MNKPSIPIDSFQQEDRFTNARIGPILTKQGKICPPDIEGAVSLQNEQHTQFREAAQHLGAVTEDDVGNALTEERGAQSNHHQTEQHTDRYHPELVATYGNKVHPQLRVLQEVRTQLMLGWFSAGHRGLAIASANQDEGTSFFAANLSLMFSRIQKRTVLVDANLLAPRQHEIFRIQQKQGLSDVLAGRAGLDALADVEAFPGLSILPAGTATPNPEELLSYDTFHALHETLCNRFNVVLYDVSAFSVSPSPLNIGALAGGVLLIVRKDRTRISDLRRTNDRLAAANGTPVVGSVLVDY
jgi:protein-tyrosine kinase